MAEDKSATSLEHQQAAPANRSRWGATFAGRKHRLRVALVVFATVVIVFVIIPRIFHSLHTVSTDDAYVNSYVTFVAPRVSGQVARVLVDDNNRVKKGEILVELDPEPFRVQVAIKQAAVDTARANLVVAQATVRSQVGQTRGLRFKLEHAIEDVDNHTSRKPRSRAQRPDADRRCCRRYLVDVHEGKGDRR